MKDKPKMAKDTAGVAKNSQITHHMRELGRTIIPMEEVSSFIVTVLDMKVNSKMKNTMVVVSISLVIKNLDMKDNLKIINRVVMEYKYKKMYQNIGDFLKIK
jgi:anaerobic ribonucleoside-triphosphate reductase